jgi:hypothetical protein
MNRPQNMHLGQAGLSAGSGSNLLSSTIRNAR